MTNRMAKLATAWDSAKVVRTREKVSFFFGVHSLLISALLFGKAPEYVPRLFDLRLHLKTQLGSIRLTDGCTSPIPCKPSISSPCVRTSTRSALGITSCLIFAITPPSLTSSISGYSPLHRPYLSLVIVLRTAPSRALSLPGGTALYSMTRTRLLRCLYTSTRRSRSRRFGEFGAAFLVSDPTVLKHM
jgi:hypothetical protein